MRHTQQSIQNLMKQKEENSKLIDSRNQLLNEQYRLESELSKIYNAKSYKLWQKINRIKSILINHTRQKILPYKQILLPVKYIYHQFYFKYLEIEFFTRLKTTTYEYIVQNHTDSPKVSILIPTYGSTGHLDVLLNSINKHPDTMTYEILICNDKPDSKKTVEDWAKENKNLLKKLHVTIISGSNNLGFVASINKLAEISKGEYLHLLNDDTEVINNSWLSALIKPLKGNDIEVSGSFLIYPDKKLVQHAGMYPFRKIDKKIYNYHYFKFFNIKFPKITSSTVPMVTGASLATKRTTFFNHDMLDYHYLGAGGFDDSDFCNKIVKDNKRIFFSYESVLIHYEGLTVKTPSKKRSLIYQHNHDYYQSKWSKFLIKTYPQYV
jgi:GT2 family glycosyltransferase